MNIFFYSVIIIENVFVYYIFIVRVMFSYSFDDFEIKRIKVQLYFKKIGCFFFNCFKYMQVVSKLKYCQYFFFQLVVDI